MTIIEKIIALHSEKKEVRAGDIVDVFIDTRVARDFGGANVVKNIVEHNLKIDDPKRTFFTFDCNPTGSDQKYAENQQKCRIFARINGIKVFDINSGIGTHIAIDNGLAWPSSTFVSTDSHANILGAIGCFGQGMGDLDVASAFCFGKVWYEVPQSVKIFLKGEPKSKVSAKDLVLFFLSKFGANGLLGYSVEVYGEYLNKLSLSDRVTISSMATEMGAIIIFFPPSQEIIEYCKKRAKSDFTPVYADEEANYAKVIELNLKEVEPFISLPGNPENVVPISKVRGKRVDSVFIGSCTNGRIEDLRRAAEVLKERKVKDGVVLKIVPSTDEIWKMAMDEGLIRIFKDAGAMVSNAGCAGCAAGQVGQNGPNEVTVSTGNRNFVGKQGKGEVYLSSPEIAAASAVAGFITEPEKLDEKIEVVEESKPQEFLKESAKGESKESNKFLKIKGRVFVIRKDNIDTDMIFHNKYLTITKIEEMGKYAFGNLQGYEDFPQKCKEGDIIITGKNFGAGSSRQQAVDCFKALKVGAIVAQSFGAIYFRNAVNAGLPVVISDIIEKGINDGEVIEIDFLKGEIKRENGEVISAKEWSDVQKEIYLKGGLLG